MSDEKGENVAQFMAITSADVDVANRMLEASDYNLEAAVNLFFTAGPEAAGAVAPPSHPATGAAADDDRASEELARRLQQEAEASEVRAADAVRTERLYDEHHLRAMQRENSAAAPPPQTLDAFRNFSAEEEEVAEGPQGLADLFKAPKDLIFNGGFDLAKEHASQFNQWLVVNIQSNEEFASHQLNRDTWADESVKTMLKTFFTFWQTYSTSEAGQRVCGFYKLHQFPTVFVVDPVTGACMAQWLGFIPPQELLEKLEPFLEISPSDGGAVQSVLKRKLSQTKAAAPSKPMTEDEEIALAMQMSMEAAAQGNGSNGGAVEAMQDTEMVDPGPTDDGMSADDAMVAALEELGEEPEASDPQAARIGVRLADGTRLQRRFLKTSPVKALINLCVANVREAAEGRQFSLKPAFPGAQPLSDLTQTLAEAGVAGAMVVMSWTD